MKSLAYIPLAIGILFAGWNWTHNLKFPPTSVAQEAPEEASKSGDATIIHKRGNKVKLRRKNARTERYRNVVINGKTVLNLGDLLIVNKGQTVVIRCESDGTTWTVPDDGLPWGVANVCVPASSRVKSV